MQVARYIRAYIPQVGSLAFEIKLPKNNTLTALQTLKLGDEDDPLFIFQYDLDFQQVKLLCLELGCVIENLDDRFDYQLECDSVPASKVKTQEQLFAFVEQDCTDFVTCITGDSDSSFGVTAAYKQDFWALKELLYKIYQQGVTDGRHG